MSILNEVQIKTSNGKHTVIKRTMGKEVYREIFEDLASAMDKFEELRNRNNN
ncbi:hypothetical protein [Leptospira phage LE4]|uniref:Uncharacterized protein n=1 Tax=Leptospira phage LE4 TaxID=2041383 RepID=A0A343LEC3_9CAUD|nr:hypothetical protein HWB34_gp20 [Leptospira phage LE4]ATN95033.1 hypothetical protein [Leptospira phage LE4]